ncbi:MAG: hypothetical protein EXX96DRAFT_572033 [Benjaminiella poitrasii]|nr:MAG: hypothetical protein EXX96DRAFT_572033 [Benjaminiella poitrasii]
MTTRFYYEDGQGRMEVTPFHLKTLTRIREYCEKQENEQLSFQEDLKNLNIDMEDVIATVKKQTKKSSYSMQLNPGASQAV